MPVREYTDVDALFNAIGKRLSRTRFLKPSMSLIGNVVEGDAKRRIGQYQPAAGPFRAWAELAPSTQADRLSRGFSANNPLERSGELKEAIQHTAGEQETFVGIKSQPSAQPRGVDLGVIAVAMEFGSSRTPPRPFMGPALFENRRKIRDIIARGIIRAIRSGTD